MSLFKRIGKGFKKAGKFLKKGSKLLAGFAGKGSSLDSLMGSGLGKFGMSAFGMHQAQKESGRQRRFQERMSSTAYQRSRSDMEAAGMNPMLAYSHGSASTPSGAMAGVPDFGGSADTAVSAWRTKYEIKNIKKQNALIGAQTDDWLAKVKVTKAQEDMIRKQIKSMGWKEPAAAAGSSARSVLDNGITAAQNWQNFIPWDSKAMERARESERKKYTDQGIEIPSFLIRR